MTVNRAQIADDLAGIGVCPGDVLLVHSALSSLGYVDGGARTVIEALLDVLKPEGTLLMPALSYKTVGPDQTTFDVLRTPSCVGAISECFRTWSMVIRSVHPTHSVCGLGPRSAEMLGRHYLDTTPAGRHSPFRALPEYGGKILMLGCGLLHNTSMHAIEELVNPPYLLGEPIEYQIILVDRTETKMTVRRHVFAGWRQRYDRIERLLNGASLKTGSVSAAKVHLIDSTAMWRAATASLQEDPFYFVETDQAGACIDL